MKGTGRNSENNEGDLQAPNRQGHSLDALIVVEIIRFGQWYVGVRKKGRERERDQS